MDLLDIGSGLNQNEFSTYSIIKLNDEQADEQANEQADEQAEEQTNEHIKTKLNLLFNYIYINNNGDLIGLKNYDRPGLITTLEHLEIYAGCKENYKNMPEEKLQEEKIMMWIVKELYTSPYKVFLNDLTREEFVLIYLKAKKYTFEKSNYQIEDLISYAIVCFHKYFEKEGRK